MTDLWPDAEVGEMISDGVVLSFEAGSAITKGDLVHLSADMTVSKCDDDAQYAIGVALKTVASGEQCPVCVRGVVKVTFGAAVTRGQAVQTNGAARAIPVADGSSSYTAGDIPDRIARALGICLTSATTGDGDTGLIYVDKA